MIRNFHVEFLSQVCGATLYHQLGEFMKRIRIFFIIFCSCIFIAALTSVLFTYKILSTEKEEIPENDEPVLKIVEEKPAPKTEEKTEEKK